MKQQDIEYPAPQLYWVETGDYLQIARGFNPMDAVKNAFRNKEPTKAVLITEVRPMKPDETGETFFINTVKAMKAVGFILE